MIDLNKHVWEGWKVRDFIDELEWQLELIANGQSWMKMPSTKKEMEVWTANHQPYYKKPIPEVVSYFTQKYNLS